MRPGKQNLKKSEFESALTELERAAELAPRHAETLYQLGKAYDALERWDEARAAYRRAVDADVSPIRRLSGINEAIREVAKKRKALLVDADKVFEDRSEHGLIGFNLVKDYVHPTQEGHQIIAFHIWDAIERAGWFGDRTPASKSVFDEVIAKRPADATSDKAVWFYNQGVLLEKQGQKQAAIENYEEALRIRDDYVPAMTNLGALLVQVGQPQAAVMVLEHAVKLNPKQPNLHNNLGGAFQVVGRLDEAIEHFQTELQLTGDDQAGVHLNLGITKQSLGRLDEAEQHFKDVLRIEPESFNAHTYWGGLLMKKNELKQAISHFKMAVQFAPDTAHGYNNLGVALMRQKSLEEAGTNFQRAIDLDADYAVAYKNLGLALAQQGNLKSAIKQFQEALRIKPNLPGVRDHLQRAMAILQQQSQ